MISQVTVRVLCDGMMFFSGQIFRIDVDRDVRKIRQAMHQLVPRFHSNRVSFGDRQLGTYSKIDLGV